MNPPSAPKILHSTTVHGETLTDDWFYLRDRENPATIPYIEAENAFAQTVMAPVKELEQTLYDEMVARIQETDISVPIRQGNFEYYIRTEKGKQYGVLCRHPFGQEHEQILLDCNAEAAGKEYYELAYDLPNPSGTILAFATDNDGSEVYKLRFKNLTDGLVFPEEIDNVYYSGAWADDRTFFYTTLDETKRPYRLWRHLVGSDAPDSLIYEEKDERFNIQVERTRSGKFLLLSISSHATADAYFLACDQSTGQFQSLRPRIQGVEYYAEHQGGHFWIRTNENAVNFRLLRAPDHDLNGPDPSKWEEVIPHREDTSIEGLEGFRDHLVIEERFNGLEQIRIADTRAGFATHTVAFDEPVYTVAVGGNEEYETTLVRFAYSSLVTPRSVFDYDMNTRERKLLKRYAVLGGYDPAKYTSERIFATAEDGTSVPVSLVYKKDTPRDGSSPLYLYGYGSYGITTDPGFSSERVSLLDRGWIYAMAHIRGSGDLGRRWYESGKFLHKKNTFTDFIACAELLIAQKYTSADRLAIMGGSAGGLLMGAVMNLRPDLFHTVVAHVPFVDVVNTMLDETLPLTIAEYEEWGNPNDRAYYDYMRSYSPYENVRRTKYPNLLITAGLNDPRVSYWEPAKWLAKLRDQSTGSGVMIMKTDMGAGHGGPSGRYSKMKEKAFEYAFVLTRS